MMAIKMKEIVEDSEEIQDFAKEIAGLKDMSWDITTFEHNIDKIERKAENNMVHIKEQMSNLEAIIKSEEEFIEEIKKESKDYHKNIFYKLYAGAKTSRDILNTVISYLALQLDVYSEAIQKMNYLLKEGKKHGMEKQKIDTELEILKSVKESMIAMAEQNRKTNFERSNASEEKLFKVMDRLTTGIEILVKYVKEEDKKKPDQNFLIQNMTRRMEELERKSKEKPEPREPREHRRPTPKKELPKKVREFKKLKSLIENDGVTDITELADRMDKTPMQIRMMGYKKLVEKASSGSPSEIEENNDMIEPGGVERLDEVGELEED